MVLGYTVIFCAFIFISPSTFLLELLSPAYTSSISCSITFPFFSDKNIKIMHSSRRYGCGCVTDPNTDLRETQKTNKKCKQENRFYFHFPPTEHQWKGLLYTWHPNDEQARCRMGATDSPWTAPQPEDSAAAAHVLVTHDHGITERSPLEGLGMCVCRWSVCTGSGLRRTHYPNSWGTASSFLTSFCPVLSAHSF